jgi:hypothetical protein
MKELEAIHREYKTYRKDRAWLANKIYPYATKLVPEKHFYDLMREIISLCDECDVVIPKNRNFLQRLGTDIVRKYNNDAWVEYAISSAKANDTFIAIDDVRFKNEAIKLKENGFIVVRLNMNEAMRRENIIKLYGKSMLTPELLFHKSEVDLDDYEDFDFVFENDMNPISMVSFAKEIYDLAIKRQG